MKTRYFRVLALCGVACVAGACRKLPRGPAEIPASAVLMAPELQSNGLGGLPGAVYQNQADSPIHWQAWTRDSLKRAKESRRLVFGVIALPQGPQFQKVLAGLAGNAETVKDINDRFVPVLIDGDASRELTLLSAELCLEIDRRLDLPVFVWMTYEGNPVAWLPVKRTDASGVLNLYRESRDMVSQMWKDAPAYVLKNSALDNLLRRTRMENRKISNLTSEQPAVDVVRSIRQLASLYDPTSRSFDEAGGLFPAGSIELLASAAVHPGLPGEVRARAMETTRNLMADLLPSAMFDPLDGGAFSARRGLSWTLPIFVRDCVGQAKVAVALLEAYRATGDARVLEKALGVIAFAEKSYGTGEGLFSMGLSEPSSPEQWMWSLEDIEKALAPKDANWWIQATGMKALGNLPSELDPRREYFRCNTLGLVKTLAEMAAAESQTPEAFAPRFDAAKARLLAVRDARIGKQARDDCSHAGATFRMVSAYAAAFGVTGDEAYRSKALALLKRAREAFYLAPRLRVFSKKAPDSIGAGRAFDYALALQTVLDVASISSDESWLFWSEDLATAAAELFSGNEFLKECPDDAKLIDLPLSDLMMVFDDSTAGLVSSAECRLAARGRPLVTSFSELATPMPTYALQRPVLHTDLLLATMARHYRVMVVPGADLPPGLKLATERLSMRVIQRRAARPGDQVPAGSVKVILPVGESRLVSTPEALQEAVLPLRGK
jgi:uncharacterized protein YyaL (SSP411 family)